MAAVPTIADLQTLIQQLQDQVLALETAAAIAAPTVPAATTAATTTVVFANTPQTLGAEDLIDYLSKRGSDIYKQGIAPLDDKSLTNGFNMTANQKKDEAWKKEPPKAGENKTGKKVGKFTFNWCKHHMAWTVHKPADCLLGKQHKDEQKKTFKANSATVADAATLAVNPQFAALMAAMDNLDMSENE